MNISKLKREIACQIIESQNPVHVIAAGAGTGKTTLLEALVSMILRDDPKARILFTGLANKTITRGIAVIGESQADFLNCHQLGYKIIRDCPGKTVNRSNVRFMGYRQDITLRRDSLVLDEEASKRLMRSLAKENSIDVKIVKSAIGYLGRCYAARKCVKLGRTQAPVKQLIRAYQKYKVENGAIDFHDMIVLAWALLKQKPSLRKNTSNQYDYILLDEAQDISRFQWDTLQSFMGKKTKLVMVGDVCQMAYGFLGAEVDLFQRAIRDGADSYKLKSSRRCPMPICHLSNAITTPIDVEGKSELMPFKGKTGELPHLFLHRGQYDGVQFVVSEIKKLIATGMKPSDFVILFRVIKDRSSKPLFTVLCEGLDAKGIPFSYRDRLAKEWEPYQKVYSALRVALKCHDRTDLTHTLTWLPGVGSTNAAKLSKNFESYRDPKVKALIDRLQQVEPNRSFTQTVRHVAEVGRSYEQLPDAVFQFFLGFSHIEEAEAEWESRLVEVLTGKNTVTISTVHSFKGDERKVVFVIGVGLMDFPYRHGGFMEDHDQERCLLNIAITRTIERLYLTCKERGGRREGSISPFLKPLIVEGYIEVVRS